MRATKIYGLFILIGTLLITVFSSCTSSLKNSDNNYSTFEYTVDNFDMIKLEGGYNVKIEQGKVPGISMKTSESNHERIDISVNNNVLRVTTKAKNIGTEEVTLYITVTDLKDINVEGGVFLTTSGFIDVEDFNIRVQGGAHIDMQITATKIRARAEGGVNMEFEGVTDEFIAVTEGAGNIDADNLKSRIVTCRVTGVGNASVYATEHLDASVEGVGKIGYRGQPTVSKQTHGIGFVYRK